MSADRELDPLPKEPWTADVRIWRSGDTAQPCGASIPRTVIWHSPDGFNYGYAGSGPADLALNILNAFVPPDMAMVDFDDDAERSRMPVKCFEGYCSDFAARHHQKFKVDFLLYLKGKEHTISARAISEWIKKKGLGSPRP